MMQRLLIFTLFLLVIVMISCDQSTEIKQLLDSKSINDQIEGVYKAGESGDKQYVPFLLHDAGNPSASTALHFKGFTMYTEKMYALERILHVKPPHQYGGILRMPDSVNIKFYNELWQTMNKPK